MSKAAMLARLEEIAGHLGVQGHQLCAEDMREVAAWLRAACVVEGGHHFAWLDRGCGEQICVVCEERRADGTEGEQ